MLASGCPLYLALAYTLKIYTEAQMGDSFILFAGIIATVLFLVGYGLTIKEFRELEDERITDSFPEKSNAEIKK